MPIQRHTGSTAPRVFDYGDGTHAPVVQIDGVVQAIPDYTSAAELLASYDNFSGVVAGDFVTRVSSSNGQAITALSGSPFTIGESTIVLDKPVLQPCAMEIEASMIRARHQFATLALFADSSPGADPVPDPINIVSIYQSNADNGVAYSAVAGTIVTITIDTALPLPGLGGAVYLSDWINVDGLIDNRLNYPNLAIKFISADRKTITAGFSDDVALPSLAVPTITPTPGTAKIYFYNNMAGAHDGAGYRFTGTTATSAAILTLFGGGDVQISGTLIGDHRTTIGSTAPAYIVGVNGNSEIKATTRYKIECRPSETAFLDKIVDSIATPFTPRVSRTGVKPASQSNLRPRFRLYRPRSMSRPIAKIVSASKAGSTTATVTMDVTCASVGLVTGSYVTVKGSRDATNFAPLTTPVAITVTGSNTFTLVWGGVFTGTSYGGTVVLANGSLDISSAIGQTIQSISVDATTGWATAIGNVTWTGISVGDYVDLHGVRADTTGADLGCDGAWEVASLSATSLVLKPISNIWGVRVTPAISSLASTNSGGTILLRTTLRSHDLLFEQWTEQRVMIDGAGTQRVDKAVPAAIVNVPAVTLNSGTVTTVSTVAALTGGGAAEDAAAGANPVTVGGVVRTAVAPTSLIAGDAARVTMTSGAAAVNQPYAVPEVTWQTPAPVGGLLNTVATFQIKEAAGALVRNHITAIDFWSEALTNATDLRIREADITCSSQTIASNTLTTSAAHDLSVGDTVVFSASTVTGITAGVTYWVLTVPSTTTLTLSASRGGSVLAISGAAVTATFHKVLWQTRIPTTGAPQTQRLFPTPLRGSPNKALLLQTATASGAGAVHLSAQGHVSP